MLLIIVGTKFASLKSTYRYDVLIFRSTLLCLVDPLASYAHSIFPLFFSGVFGMIDNAVPSVAASMNDENLDEEREGGWGGRRQRGE